MTWFTLAGLVIALTAAVAAMRAARQRHPANRVTCVHCGEQVTGPTAEHICGMPS